jgi:hypothetical protein
MSFPCHSCQHRRYRIYSAAGGHVVVFGCEVRHIRFGYQWEYKAGNNMPEKCDELLTNQEETCKAK